jgi:hypothetical protein
VHVAVAIHDAGTAEVDEEYALPGLLGDTPFEFLASPCASVGPVAAALGDRRLAVSTDARTHAPWTSLRLGAYSKDGDRGDVLTVRYEVRMRGSESALPIVLPAAVLAHADNQRGAAVRLDVTVRESAGDARVLLPRLERAPSDRSWQGSYLAIPALVRVSHAAAGECDRPAGGSSSGLEWRTAVFAATMATWVPIYLWWFGRRCSHAS